MKETFPVRVSRYLRFQGTEDKVDLFTEEKVGKFRFTRKLFLSCRIRDRKVPFIRKALRWNKKWGDCSVSVRKPPKFPHVEEFNVGSIQMKTELEKALAGRNWFYETEKVEFLGPDEAGVFGFGWAAFTLLRKAKAIPGRLTKTGCARKAIEWVEEYRAWKAAGYPEGFVKPETPKGGVEPDA